LLVNKNTGKNKFVTHSVFIPQYNIYVLAIFDKKEKESSFEIYAFKKIGVVQDNY